MKEAAGRGERSVVYAFEEWIEILINRCESINIPVDTMIKRGTLSVPQEPFLRFTPDEFRQLGAEVEQQRPRIVMIDAFQLIEQSPARV